MFKNSPDDFFEFLGFQDAIKKTNEIYNDNDSFSQFGNTPGNFENTNTTKYPYVSAFDDCDDEYDDE